MNVSDMNRNQSIDLILVAGITPLLAMTHTALTGFFAGLIILVLMFATACLSHLVQSYIPHERKWLAILLIAAILVGISNRIVEAFSPELHHIFGIYLPLLVVVPVCSFLPVEYVLKQKFADGMKHVGKITLIYFLTIGLFACLRELITSGTLLLDSAQILGPDYSVSFVTWNITLVSGVSGALLLAGVLLALLQYVRPATR